MKKVSYRGTNVVNYSKLESAGEIHDMEGIILLLDLTQPLHILTIHLLQRRPRDRIVGVSRRILEVLAVLDPSFGNGSTQIADAVEGKLVEILVVPRNKEARWEDGVGAVGRVRGWWAMFEDAGLVCIEVEYDQDVLVRHVELVTPGLHRKLRTTD